MKASSCFPSKYLKASDLPSGKDVMVTIDRVEIETIVDGEDKPVLYFLGKAKGVVLNKDELRYAVVSSGRRDGRLERGYGGVVFCHDPIQWPGNAVHQNACHCQSRRDAGKLRSAVLKI